MGMQYVQFRRRTCFLLMRNDLITFCRSLSTKISYSLVKGSSSGHKPIVLSHGALGNKNNFNTIAKRLNKSIGCSVVTYDARNHGKSMHYDHMSLDSMTQDLVELLDSLEIDKCVLVGHSMGGRMAMLAALNQPQRFEKLVVVDASPCSTFGNKSNNSRGALLKYINAMKAVQWKGGETLSVARANADNQLKDAVVDPSVRSFILTNVEQLSTGKFGWRVNLDALNEHLQTFQSITLANGCGPYTNETLFIAGGASTFVGFEDYAHIKRLFPAAVISHIPEAGHWVHSEKPLQFMACLEAFLKPNFFPLHDEKPV